MTTARRAAVWSVVAAIALVACVLVIWLAWPRPQPFSDAEKSSIAAFADWLARSTDTEVDRVETYPVHNPLGPDWAAAAIDLRPKSGAFTESDRRRVAAAVRVRGWVVDSECSRAIELDGRCPLLPAADVYLGGGTVGMRFSYESREPALSAG